MPQTLGFPHLPYLIRILGRTVVMWLLVKLLFLALFGIVGGESAFLLPSLGIPALLVYIDRQVAHEGVFQANLGVSEWWLAGSTLALSLLLDAVVSALASTFLAG